MHDYEYYHENLLPFVIKEAKSGSDNLAKEKNKLIPGLLCTLNQSPFAGGIASSFDEVNFYCTQFSNKAREITYTETVLGFDHNTANDYVTSFKKIFGQMLYLMERVISMNAVITLQKFLTTDPSVPCGQWESGMPFICGLYKGKNVMAIFQEDYEYFITVISLG